MASRDDIKSLFEDGDVMLEDSFSELIDTMALQEDLDSQSSYISDIQSKLSSLG